MAWREHRGATRFEEGRQEAASQQAGLRVDGCVATDSEEVLSEEAWGHFANMLSPLPDVRKLQLEALKKPYIDANDNREHAGFLGTIAGLNATLQGEMRRAWKVRLLKLQQGFFSKATGGRK